jgi:hypothetical protein
MARVSAEVERTFVRLWTHCDDEGRAVDNVKLLKAALFPLHDEVTPAEVDADLDELAHEGLLVRYEAAGKRYLQVVSWGEFQHPQKPKKSTIPSPSDTSTGNVPDDDATGKGLEWSRRGEGEGDGEGAPAREFDAIVREHFAATMGARYDEVEVDAQIKTARARGYGDDEIRAHVVKCTWPRELSKELPSRNGARAPEPPRPREPLLERCETCEELTLDCTCEHDRREAIR